MPPTEKIDPETAKRMGLTEVLCRACGRLLAHQSSNGRELVPNESARVVTGRVGLKCWCGYITEWRSSRPAKPGKRRPFSPPG